MNPTSVVVDVTASAQREAWLERERAAGDSGEYARHYGTGRRLLHWWPVAYFIQNYNALEGMHLEAALESSHQTGSQRAERASLLVEGTAGGDD